MVQALRHEQLPATLHAARPSAHVDWSAGRVALLTEPRPWPAGERVRRAGVSSFGISGTNAHVLLEQAPPAPDPAPTTAPGPYVWLLSARTGTALRAQARGLAEWLPDGADPAAVAAALAGRTTFRSRAALVAPDLAGFRAALADLASGAAPVPTGSADPVRTAFVLTGQGSHRPGMGAQLRARSACFAAALDEVCDQLDPLLPRPLPPVLSDPGAAELLASTQYAQPAIFAFQVAAGRLLADHGIRPDVLIGHSVGEVAAAHLAGVLDLADACTLVAARGRLMEAAPAGGAMAAVQANEAELRETISEIGGRLDVAAVNAPDATVVSGDEAAVLAVLDRWRSRGRRTSRLDVRRAFHSPHMDGLLDEFGRVVAGLALHPPQLPLVSALTGGLAGEEITDPAFWVRHARRTVRFADAVRAASDAGVTAFLEVGARPALLSMVAGSLPADRPPPALLTICRDGDEHAGLLGALAGLHGLGAPVRWRIPDAGPVELPTYPFQHRRYWIDAAGPAPAAAPQRPEQAGAEEGGAEEDGAEEDDGDTLADRIAGRPAHEQREILRELVAARAAAVLGHDGLSADAQFLDLGFTSLSAVELRNQLCAVTGLSIPAGIVYDLPTPAAFASYLHEQLVTAREGSS